MPTNTTDLREQLIALIADAIAANEDKMRSPYEIANEVVQQSGLRRAAWACFSSRQQTKMINDAWRRAKEKNEKSDA